MFYRSKKEQAIAIGNQLKGYLKMNNDWVREQYLSKNKDKNKVKLDRMQHIIEGFRQALYGLDLEHHCEFKISDRSGCTAPEYKSFTIEGIEIFSEDEIILETSKA